jgi:hypothetical protein
MEVLKHMTGATGPSTYSEVGTAEQMIKYNTENLSAADEIVRK